MSCSGCGSVVILAGQGGSPTAPVSWRGDSISSSSEDDEDDSGIRLAISLEGPPG
jgi:hypothetical protein